MTTNMILDKIMARVYREIKFVPRYGKNRKVDITKKKIKWLLFQI